VQCGRHLDVVTRISPNHHQAHWRLNSLVAPRAEPDWFVPKLWPSLTSFRADSWRFRCEYGKYALFAWSIHREAVPDGHTRVRQSAFGDAFWDKFGEL
jgi:hypothetical protein